MSVKVQNLYKSYGTQLVLDNINFTIPSGQIVGFLGNNGAGKSTTMKIITGYVDADKGDIEVCGINIKKEPLEANRKIGYLPEHNPIYPEMFVKEYLRFVANFYKLGRNSKSRVDEMIEKTGLTREYKKKIGMLSKGYRQRVGLAQALIADPEVLILDEPTTGLDPNQIVEVRNLIKEIGKEKTVMLSTHIMQEVSAICERVIIINKGQIVADDKESSIVSIDMDSGYSILVEFDHPQELERLQMLEEVISVSCVSCNTYVFNCVNDIRESIFRYAVNHGHIILTMKQQEKSMEDVFRSLTQN
jgi:ABC-2 type transport system ATP-binding protein